LKARDSAQRIDLGLVLLSRRHFRPEHVRELLA
jgi:hypothetical protein